MKQRMETDLASIKANYATKSDVAELRADMHKLSSDISRWTLATMIAIVGTMVAALFGFSQLQRAERHSAPPQIAPVIITIPAQSVPTAVQPSK